MNPSKLQEFYLSLQKQCLPGIWSKGVAWARDNLVRIDSQGDDEIILRVKLADRAVSPKVSLWPGDEDYFCDCGDRAEPCAHVAAAVAALKTGLKPEAPDAASAPIRYRFVRVSKALGFERWVGEMELKESLVRLVGGIDSGRIAGRKLAATQDDFAVDHALGAGDRRENRPGSRVDRITLGKLFSALRSVPGVELDSVPVQLGTPTRGLHAELRDDAGGFRLVGVEDVAITEIFENGAVLAGGVLRMLEDPGLSQGERALLQAPGRWFGLREAATLVSEILPALEKKIPIQILAKKLPTLTHEPPRVVLRLEKSGEERLSVTPLLTYASDFALKDPDAERQLLRKLQSELQLSPGQRVEYQGVAAVEFAERCRAWDTTGDGGRNFALESALGAEFLAEDGGFRFSFKNAGGKSADSARVLQAWKMGETYVPLLGGGYAGLPSDWLARFGSRLQRLILAREENEGRLPSFLRPELAELAEEMGGEITDTLRLLRERLGDFEKIPEVRLPADLTASLRHYQVQGVNWLCFLRDSGMGALLADDMGLGKTLQALCAIQGRTLVVAPTSVLSSWADQIRLFRPGLKVALFYGAGRKLDPEADVTITTYGLLRLDRERLLGEKWETAILDEAQTIKNPESQVAQAAHQLKADFRLTLSGTPVENSMEDLWSQFRFLNPGLLGTLREFQDEFSGPVSRGDAAAVGKLRARIKPFILRRMKREVAPELPPRTEVVLESELTDSERDLYDALLASGRKEVLEKLEAGGSVFGALELLLRLRQCCCHPALVPGQTAETSSKLELLAQSLESSVAQGHRALVFSQWTSFLDLIGPRLEEMGLKYSRLDGSTMDRAAVVAEFQDPQGPPVMLISLKAGGVGLTLTAADHVYLMDSWWNPAVEDQAADRVHRIGQENPVLVCRVIARGTLEERILELQKRKLQLASSVLDGAAAAVSLTREDIFALLEPG